MYLLRSTSLVLPRFGSHAHNVKDGHAPMYVEIYISMICLNCNPSNMNDIFHVEACGNWELPWVVPSSNSGIYRFSLGSRTKKVISSWWELESWVKKSIPRCTTFFPGALQSSFPNIFFWESHISNWQVYHSHTSRTTSIAAEPAIVWGNSQYSKLSTKKNHWHEIVNGMNSATRSSTTDL